MQQLLNRNRNLQTSKASLKTMRRGPAYLRALRQIRGVVLHIVLYLLHLYSASCSVHQSEAFPVRET